jgi:hypothetical protein
VPELDLRSEFAMMVSASLVLTNGSQRSLQPLTNAVMASVRSQTEPKLDLVDLGRSTVARLVVQGANPAGILAGPPIDHRRPAGPGPARDLRIGQSRESQQHDPRPRRQPRPNRARSGQRFESRSLSRSTSGAAPT